VRGILALSANLLAGLHQVRPRINPRQRWARGPQP
jgi:hypothetical protein